MRREYNVNILIDHPLYSRLMTERFLIRLISKKRIINKYIVNRLDSHMMEFGVLRIGSMYYYIKGTIAT